MARLGRTRLLLPKCRKGLKEVVLECLKDKSKKKLTPMRALAWHS
jgi:hypothetical protein